MIFNIQRFSTHDGKGIRTVIFYKGCPLRCLWCSNPEGISYGYSLMYDKRICKGFGECIRAEGRAIRKVSGGILIDRARISHPETLKDICPSRALTVAGEEKSVAELLQEIEKDRPFYRDGGGVTLSGGEPLSHSDEVIPLLRELQKRKIPVDIETSLHVPWEKIEASLGLVDTFLADLKHIDNIKFRMYTGGNARLVTDNLEKLVTRGARIILRIPVIPGFNHTEREMFRMIDYAALLGIREIHFLPYHTLGMEKYKMLGQRYHFDIRKPVLDDEAEPYVQYAENKGITTKIGG
jgi:pyruvate formate lyase activating enzyme